MTTVDNTASSPATSQVETSASQDGTVELDSPVQRGETTVTAITLRKPRAGELRGLNLTDLLQMDVTALQTLIPRISQPMLTKPEVANMDPADLTQCGAVVAGFLLTKRDRASAFPTV